MFGLAKMHQKPTRETSIMPLDVYNIAYKWTINILQRHPKDAMIVHFWLIEYGVYLLL